MYKLLALTAAAIASTSIAIALPAPTGSPGTLPANSFGGSGIPTHHVMLDTYSDLTIGLSAHQRLVGPNLVNDGNGTFFAPAGEGDPGLAKWNFAFYINNPGGLNSYLYRLTVGSDALGYASIPPLVYPDNYPTLSTTTAGNSQNLGFGYWAVLGLTGFDPSANDTYGVTLEAFSSTDTGLTTPLAGVTINVQVGTGASVPDAGSTSMLLGIALTGFATLRRLLA